MANIDFKEEYAKVLASGMFFEWFPDLTGTWEEDKDQFIALVSNFEWAKK